MTISIENKSYGVLVDLTKCIGCGSCSVACKLWNELDWDDEQKVKTAKERAEEPNKGLWANDWTSINLYETEKNNTPVFRFVKTQCMHCEEPACVSSCFAAALNKLSQGPVIYDQSRCVGCRYCMLSCPFDIPRYDWKKVFPGVRKCQMCPTRVANDMLPACVSACPTGALTFGNREDLLVEAKDRIQNGDYINHIYGEKEAGGTSWLYISDVEFSKLGFKTDISDEPVSSYVKEYLKIALGTSTFVLLGLAGMYWWFNGRNKPLDEEPVKAGKGGKNDGRA
jgi:Fe-S-cluster-containing dehydrogenase component